MTEKVKPLPTHCDLCADPETGEPERLYLHAKCHLTAPLQAVLEGDVLTLSCYLPECRRVVARLKVAGILTTREGRD